MAISAIDIAAVEAASGRFARALHACHEAVATQESARAYALLAQAFLLGGVYEEATAASERAIELDGEYLPSYVTLGLALDARGGMADRSLLVWHEIAQMRPDDALVHAHLGEALYDAGLQGEAIAAWNEAVRCDPDGYRALYDLALAALRSEGVTTALPGLRTAGELDPDRDQLFFRLLAPGEAGATSVPQEVAALIEHATSAAASEDYLEAMDAVRAILDVDADHARALSVASLIYFKQASVNEAMACALRALAITHDTPGALLVLGSCCASRQGMDEAAANIFGALVRAEPAEALSSVLLAEALLGLGRGRDALRLLRRAVALQPASVHGHFALAAALFAEHRFAEAAWHARRARAHDDQREMLFWRVYEDEETDRGVLS